ncbi:MAG: V-type ATP synthase subunit E family protein [Hungatella sp.]
MTGLEKIIGRMQAESNAAVAQTLEKAQAEADRILERARQEAREECALIERRSESKITAIQERAESAAELKKRQSILAEKQGLIAEIIDKAEKRLTELEDTEYFQLITNLAKKSAQPGEGFLLFSPKDLARIPENFEQTLQGILDDPGKKLTLSKETRDIEGGFVLVYGGIEENCSFKALFDSAHEILQDKVQTIIGG